MTSSGVSEQILNRYLLNELTEEERGGVEERLFTNRTFIEQIETAEMGLVDRYVLGEMTGDEQERFVSQYLPVPEHARRVREAEQFHAQLKLFGSKSFRKAAKRAAPALAAVSLLAAATSLLHGGALT